MKLERDGNADYYTLNFSALWKFLRSPLLWVVATFLGAWIYSAYVIFTGSYIQYSPDTFLYKALSQQQITLHFLTRGIRSPTLPILLKFFKTEIAFVYFQLAFFFLSWGMLFLVLRKLFKSYIAYLGALCVLMPLSLAQAFFSWHKLILTESISLSGAVLLLALLSRFMMLERVTTATVNCVLVPWILWQFTRDANAFFSLSIALGVLATCTIARIGQRDVVKWKRGQFMALVICLFAVFQMYSISNSDRWKFPLVDVIALRVLPDPELTKEFVEMGMPLNDKVTCFKGQTAVDCNKDWSGFGDWMESGEARGDYQSWLIRNFPRALAEIFDEWEKIWTTETILYGRSNNSPVPELLTRIAIPKGHGFLLFITISFIAATLALCVAMHHHLRSWLSVLLLFYVANLPLAFVAYHGDALDVDRHTLNVQLNTYLTGWTLIFWSISFTLNNIRMFLWLLARKVGGLFKR